MGVREGIAEKLTTELNPVHLDVVDESHLHKGHMGARPEGETHFRVTVVSAAFAGLSRVERQKRVYAILAEEMAGPVHALALKTHTPDEAGSGEGNSGKT